MKKIILFCCCILFSYFSIAQNVGIGTSTPDYRLHVLNSNSSLLKLENTTSLATDTTNDLFFKTGSYYTGGVKTIGTGFNVARLGFFTYSSGVASGLLERLSILDNGNVGIGILSPVHQLQVITSTVSVNAIHGVNSGITSGANWSPSNNYSGVHGEAASGTTQFQAGVFGYQIGSGNNSGGVVGAFSASTWGGLGYTDGSAISWGVYTPANLYTGGKVGVGNTIPAYPLDVIGDFAHLGNFVNTKTFDLTASAVYASCNNNAGYGVGIEAFGGETGVKGEAILSGGPYSRFGVYGTGRYGNANYGVYGIAVGTGSSLYAYGVYATAYGASENWAGYFVGGVSATVYVTSDRKLKNDIRPLSGAISIINQLNPSVYTFKTNEYKQMNLPEGLHYGLIADEVQTILPGAVKKAIQPAEYENHDEHNGKKLSDNVEFNAVNYTEIIPILIGAVKEQQQTIEGLLKRIETLEKKK